MTQDAYILHLINGRLLLVESAYWSHPRDVRPTGSFRGASRIMLEHVLAEVTRDGQMPNGLRRYCLSIGLGPLSMRALREEMLRRFDSRQLTAIWIPAIVSLSAQPASAVKPGFSVGPVTLPPPTRGLNVANMSLQARFAEVLLRCAYLLPAEMRDQFLPIAIGFLGQRAVQVLAVWAASHAVGLGEILDVILIVIGGLFLVTLGLAALNAGIALVRCIYITQRATTDKELDEAASNLATFVTFIGVLGFMKAVDVMQKRPSRGGRASKDAEIAEPEAPRNPSPSAARDSRGPRPNEPSPPNVRAAAPPRVDKSVPPEWLHPDGSPNWNKLPPNGFRNGESVQTTLPKGTMLDRYGGRGGQFLSPAGTPYEARSLPWEQSSVPLERFRVLKAMPVESGEAAAGFGRSGGGIQHMSPMKIQDAIDQGYLEVLR